MVTSKLNFVTAGASVTEFDLTARAWQELGHTVTAVTAFSKANDIPTPRPYQVAAEQINSRRQLGIQYGVYKLLKKYEAHADVFQVDGHLFLYGAGAYRMFGGAVPVVAFFNRELIAWPENTSALFYPGRRTPWLVKLKKKVRYFLESNIGTLFASRIDRGAFTNPVLEQSYKDFGLSFPRGRSIIVGDPFDYQSLMSEYGVTVEHYRARNKQAGKLIIFYSSRMAPGKGFDLLIKAFAEVKNKEQFTLVLGGSGPEEGMVHGLVKELGLSEHVVFPGWMSKMELYEYLKKADLFVQARWRHDMTSYSLLDAMAFGLPSILPGGGGMQWDAEDAALYFTDEDYQDLARKIEQLGADYELRNRLSANCYRRLGDDQMNYRVQAARLIDGLK